MICSICGEKAYRGMVCEDCRQEIDDVAYERSEAGQKLAP